MMSFRNAFTNKDINVSYFVFEKSQGCFAASSCNQLSTASMTSRFEKENCNYWITWCYNIQYDGNEELIKYAIGLRNSCLLDSNSQSL